MVGSGRTTGWMKDFHLVTGTLMRSLEDLRGGSVGSERVRGRAWLPASDKGEAGLIECELRSDNSLPLLSGSAGGCIAPHRDEWPERWNLGRHAESPS